MYNIHIHIYTYFCDTGSNRKLKAYINQLLTMYLALDIIIKLKFTTNFDRCALLNVLNYFTKNFES